MAEQVRFEIGHRHRPACALRRAARPDTISRPLKSRHRRDFPLRVAASNHTITTAKKQPPEWVVAFFGGAGEIRPAALGQCRRQLGELKSHPPDAFSPSRGRSLRIPPALHHNNKRPPQGRSFAVGGAGEIRTHGRLSTVTRFPVVPVMTTSILLHNRCGRAYVAALDYDTILFA